MEIVQELGKEVFYNMQKYSQITIDYVEDVEGILNTEFETEQERLDNLGSTCYGIDLLLEVINPILEDDIRVLKSMKDTLEEILHNRKR